MNLDSLEKSQRLKDSRQSEKEKSVLEIFSPSFTLFPNMEQNQNLGFWPSFSCALSTVRLMTPPTPPMAMNSLHVK